MKNFEKDVVKFRREYMREQLSSRFEKGKTERSSNLELLRIFCIIAIIGDHFVGQSGVYQNTSLETCLFYGTIVSLSRVACSVFIIISAWFTVDKPFRIKRVFHTWLTVIMYTVPISLIGRSMGIFCLENSEIYGAFFPVEESPLWFAGYYIVLVLFSPLLNLFISKTSRKNVEMFIGMFFLLQVLYSTLTAKLGFFNNDIWTLIFLYVLTGYIKKYKSIPSWKKSFCVFILVWGCLCVVRGVSAYYSAGGSYIFSVIVEYGEIYRARLQTLPNLIISYSLFFAFLGMKIKNSKIVNTMAKTTLGIYCLHQVPGWYTYLWSNVFKAGKYVEILSSKKLGLYTIAIILSVWLVGTVIEVIRSRISVCLIESRKWYINVCDEIDNYVNIRVNENDDDETYRSLWKKIIIIFSVYFLLAKLCAMFL